MEQAEVWSVFITERIITPKGHLLKQEVSISSVGKNHSVR